MDVSVLIGATGVLVGVIGAWLAFKYGRHKPRLVYCLDGAVVVDSTRTDDVELTWRGRKVPSVSRTTISVWNAGSHTLDGEEIVRGYPLRFIFGGDVLLVDQVASSKKENGFSVSIDPNDPVATIIQFTYLDPRHGGTFEVTHASGTWLAVPEGAIKGAEIALTRRLGATTSRIHYAKIRGAAALLTGLMGVFAGYYQYRRDRISSIAFAIAGLIYLLYSIAAFALALRKPPAALRPHGADARRKRLSEGSPRRARRRFLRM
jgi:uncharacterized membrane protein YsdA (DUF1294 family)